MKVLVAQSCPTLCDPMDCSLPGFSVHGILQATTLEWVPIHFSRDSSWPRDWTWVSRIAGRFFTVWAIREALILLEANLILVYCFGRACPLETGSKSLQPGSSGTKWTVRTVGISLQAVWKLFTLEEKTSDKWDLGYWSILTVHPFTFQGLWLNLCFKT